MKRGKNAGVFKTLNYVAFLHLHEIREATAQQEMGSKIISVICSLAEIRTLTYYQHLPDAEGTGCTTIRSKSKRVEMIDRENHGWEL